MPHARQVLSLCTVPGKESLCCYCGLCRTLHDNNPPRSPPPPLKATKKANLQAKPGTRCAVEPWNALSIMGYAVDAASEVFREPGEVRHFDISEYCFLTARTVKD